MDYIALGHIHKRSDVQKRGATSYAYPGCPEGMGFDELGEKGVYIGEVYKGGVNLAFYPVCRRMNLEARADITDAAADRAAASMVLTALHDTWGEGFDRHLYKLSLTGAPAPGYTPDCAAIAQMIADAGHVYYCKAYNRTSPP